ncbi:hypothetical protein B0H34DRAFT_659418, partial [Crassisporium funariophilum]
GNTDAQERWSCQLIWEVARHTIGEELVVYPLMEKHLGAEGKKLAVEDRAIIRYRYVPFRSSLLLPLPLLPSPLTLVARKGIDVHICTVHQRPALQAQKTNHCHPQARRHPQRRHGPPNAPSPTLTTHLSWVLWQMTPQSTPLRPLWSVLVHVLWHCLKTMANGIYYAQLV